MKSNNGLIRIMTVSILICCLTACASRRDDSPVASSLAESIPPVSTRNEAEANDSQPGEEAKSSESGDHLTPDNAMPEIEIPIVPSADQSTEDLKSEAETTSHDPSKESRPDEASPSVSEDAQEENTEETSADDYTEASEESRAGISTDKDGDVLLPELP